MSGLRIGKQGPSTRPCTNLGQNDGRPVVEAVAVVVFTMMLYIPESINNWEADVRLKLSTDDRYEG